MVGVVAEAEAQAAVVVAAAEVEAVGTVHLQRSSTQKCSVCRRAKVVAAAAPAVAMAPAAGDRR